MTTQERFSPGVDEQIRCYVYALIDPRDDEIFYVGKGTRNRCFAHVAEASSTRKISVDDYEKLDRIREIQNASQRVITTLLRHGLSDAEALLVESAVIDALGLQGRDLTNRVAGRETRLQGRMSVEEVMPDTRLRQH